LGAYGCFARSVGRAEEDENRTVWSEEGRQRMYLASLVRQIEVGYRLAHFGAHALEIDDCRQTARLLVTSVHDDGPKCEEAGAERRKDEPDSLHTLVNVQGPLIYSTSTALRG
jgi:hypothetical protein